jgi:penicillin-binding protein 1A
LEKFVVKRLFLFLGTAALMTCFGMAALAALVVHDLPQIDSLKDYRPPQATRVYDPARNLVAEFYFERRTVISIKDLPAHVKNAFLAAEDAHFYEHSGIDYAGLIRAIATEIKYRLIGGQRVGGSTITQQAAKTMLLSRKKTYIRKIKEIILARRIEQKLTKDEILNLYLNQIYFGQSAYGIEEAAQVYFGKNAKNLTVVEAASLAAIPKSPNHLNPIANPQRLKERRNYILQQMAEKGFIPKASAIAAQSQAVETTKNQAHNFLNKAPHYTEAVRRILIEKFGEDTVYYGGLEVEIPVNMPMQIAAQKAMVTGLKELDKRQGYRGPVLRPTSAQTRQLGGFLKEKCSLLGESFSKGFVWDLKRVTEALTSDSLGDPQTTTLKTLAPHRGLSLTAIVTGFDAGSKGAKVDLGATTAILPLEKMLWARPFNPEEATPKPKQASDVLKVGDIILVKLETAEKPWVVSLDQLPKADGALIAIQPMTHRVQVLLGGYDFEASSFNRALQAKRQTGSAIKPFVYSLAIDKEIVTPATIITDAPRIFLHGTEDQWRPNNQTKKFFGDITIRTCLIRSVNTCSIQLLEKMGIAPFRKLASDVGMLTEKTPFPSDLTVSLGSADVFPISLVNAYSMFPNGGRYSPPILIERVKDPSGKVLFEAESSAPVQAIRPEAAFVTLNIMRSIVRRGPGTPLAQVTHPLAGKTGTTNEFRSAWFVGFSPDLVAGVYVGFDDNKSLGPSEFGIKAAYPIWANFMRDALRDMPVRQFEVPANVVWRNVDLKSGLLASSAAPQPSESSASPDEDVATPENLPGGSIMEAFIGGTEPTENVGERAPVPLEMIEDMPETQP